IRRIRSSRRRPTTGPRLLPLPLPPLRLSCSPFQRFGKFVRVADPTENAALGLDHGERRGLELGEIRADAVLEHQAVVAAIVRFTHGRVHAHLRRDAAHHQLADAAVVQHRVEVGGVEGALAGLVDYRLARRRLELVDDVVAVFAPHQDAPHRSGVADAVLQPAAQLLARGQVGKVRAVPLARMDHEHPAAARRVEYLARGRDRFAQQRDVVAERLAEAARVDEVALHVDDDQCSACRLELELVGLRVDLGHCRIVGQERTKDTRMPGQAKYLFIASMDVDPAKEALFNEVYDTEHIPELLKVPGVLSVRRGVTEPLTMFLGGEKKTIVAEGEPRYSAYYELESAEVLTSAAWAKAVEVGRWP